MKPLLESVSLSGRVFFEYVIVDALGVFALSFSQHMGQIFSSLPSRGFENHFGWNIKRRQPPNPSPSNPRPVVSMQIVDLQAIFRSTPYGVENGIPRMDTSHMTFCCICIQVRMHEKT